MPHTAVVKLSHCEPIVTPTAKRLLKDPAGTAAHRSNIDFGPRPGAI
jgi:hypothetical protein